MPELVVSRSYAAGERIVSRGEPGEDAYLIERGQVEVSALAPDGEETVATLGPGEVFGELAALDDGPRSASVTALVPTEVIVIRRGRLARPMKSSDPLLNLLLRVLVERFRDAQARLLTAGLGGAGVLESVDEVRARAMAHLRSERSIRDGLESGEFLLHFQPILSLADGSLAGFEGLMRWRRTDGNLVSPGEFIPMAEETGMVVELGRTAVDLGLEFARGVATLAAASGMPRVPFVSINVSAVQLGDLGEIERLCGRIEETRLPPETIKLELTERLMVENAERAAEALQYVKQRGLSVAMDDFGTGYSSLSCLHRFPIDTLKVDRSFVTALGESDNAVKITRSIISLARSLDLLTVAEGIETRDQVDILADLGCELGQGYHLGRPEPVDVALARVGS